MAKRALQVFVQAEADGFVAWCPEPDIASEGRTEEDARENLEEALELFFDEPAPR